MTIETWKAEFYPTPANECPAFEAIEHSLRKWYGLRPLALQQHGLVAQSGDLYGFGGKNTFRISADSCALCAHFYSEDDERSCEACPLARARNGTSCDRCAPTESRSPWSQWVDRSSDPEPMIAALEAALAQKNAGST